MLLQKPFSVTQGGADTAAESTLATNIQPGVTFGAWKPTYIEFTIAPNLMKAWAAADADMTIQFTKRSLTGAIARIVTYTDTDLITSISLAAIVSGTAANLQLVDATYFVALPAGLTIYSENIYVQVISAGTGQTNIVWGRILYDLVTLTQAEALAVVASRP